MVPGRQPTFGRPGPALGLGDTQSPARNLKQPGCSARLATMTGSRDLARAAIRAQFGSDKLEKALATSAYATQLAKAAFPELREDIDKYNPNHGPDGRFTSGKGGKYAARSANHAFQLRRKAAQSKAAGASRNFVRSQAASSNGPPSSAPSSGGGFNSDRDGDRVRDDYRGNSRRGKVRVHATRASLGGGNGPRNIGPGGTAVDIPAVSGGGSARAAAAARNIASARALHQRTKRNRAIGAKAQATKAGKAKLRALIAKPAAKPARAARPVKLGPATQNASASYQRAMGRIKAKRKSAASGTSRRGKVRALPGAKGLSGLARFAKAKPSSAASGTSTRRGKVRVIRTRAKGLSGLARFAKL